jgi:hypothetical protein
MTRKIVLFFIIIVCAIACSKKETTSPEVVTITDLLPRDNEISGWTRTGNSWWATSSSGLNQFINGEEPDYTRHGFVEGAMQAYEGSVLGTPATVEVRVFDQQSGDNASALFDELAVRLVNPIDWSSGAGEDAKIERFPLSQRIIFWNSKYFVSMTIDSGLDEALDVLRTFANNVDTKIP